MRKVFYLFVLIAFSLASCQRELLDPKDLHITLSPGFLFPLAHVNLDLEDVLPLDTVGPLTLTDDPYYVLTYQEDSLAVISAADLLQIPAQAPAALSVPLGLVNLPDFQSSAGISLGALSANISNPSNFGSSIASAHGSNAPFPALPNQNPGAL
ncbi:MAG: hypothetical protein P8N56_05930, partial [Schleiferiaceae bacterium]|nr:hypothetical protein [Schleiferiaceae bacterium]